MPNRYEQLIDAIPRGSFWDAGGEVLPLRSSPYEFRLQTTSPLTTYGVFVNGVFRSLVTSDADGVAVVREVLDQGEQDILLLDQTTGIGVRAFATTRLYALWMAAHAQVIEADLDAKNADIRRSYSLETAVAPFLSEVFGRIVNQPNDIGYLADTYRRTLGELRQAYRLWAPRPAGIRQAVHAFTSVNPVRLPYVWQPTWFLHDQLVPNGDFDEQTVLADPATYPTIGRFPTLNAGIRDYIVSTIPDNITPVTGFAQPPTPQNLTVTYNASWLGGDIVIRFLNQQGDELTERFPTADATALVPLPGVFEVDEILEITIDPPGTGVPISSASIGLGQSKFIELVGINGLPLPTGVSASVDVNWVYPDETLQIGTTGLVVDADTAGLITAADGFGRTADLDSLQVETPSAGAAYTYGDLNRIWLELDSLRPIRIELAPTSTAIDPALVATLNAAIKRERKYGAGLSIGDVTIATNPIEGDTVRIIDAFGSDVTFEADTDGLVAAPYNIPFTIGATTADTALSLVNAIRASAVRIFAFSNLSIPNLVDLVSVFGGVVSGTGTVTSSVPLVMIPTGMTGGVDAADYLTSVSAFSNAFGQALRLSGSPARVTGSLTNRNARVLSKVGAAHREIFGRLSEGVTTLPLATGALSATVSAGSTLPEGLPAIRLAAPLTVTSTTALTGAAVTSPDFCTCLEVLFDEEWDGGQVLVTGTDPFGNVIREVFTKPATDVVDSGLQNERSALSPPDRVTPVVGGSRATIEDFGFPGGSVEILNLIEPGAGGAAWQWITTVPAGPAPTPLALLVDTGAKTITIRLAQSGGAVVPAENTVGLIETLFETSVAARDRFLFINSAGIRIDAVSSGFFSPGVANGRGVWLMDNLPGIAPFEFSQAVQPGMKFRVLTGTYAGAIRRIVAKAPGRRYFSGRVRPIVPNLNRQATKILLATSIGDAFYNESWEVVRDPVAKGTKIFRSITSIQNNLGGTVGTAVVRVCDGPEDYGVTATYGQNGLGSAAPDMRVSPAAFEPQVTPTVTFASEAALSSPSHELHPLDRGGVIDVSGSDGWGGAVNVGLNNGKHQVIELDMDSIAIGPVNTGLYPRCSHEQLDEDRHFSLRPTTPSNYNTYVEETALDFKVLRRGEKVRIISFDPITNTVEFAYPGLLTAHPAGETIIPDLDFFSREEAGLDEGLGQYQFQIDPAFAPTVNTTDSITVRGRLDFPAPTGWRTQNVSAVDVPGFYTHGMLGQSRYRLVADGVADMTIERRVPRLLDFKGFFANVAFWVKHFIAASAVGVFRIEVSMNNFDFTSLGVFDMDGQVDDGSSNLGYGGARVDPISATFFVPHDATDPAVRLVLVGAAAGHTIVLEKCTVAALRGTGYHLGQSTIPWGETRANFGELLYVWSPTRLSTIEDRALGIPRPPLYGQPAEAGHIDGIVNAHGVWDRFDITEYSIPDIATGLEETVNLIGVYDENDWLTCTLINMELFTATPGRLSYVMPSVASRVVEALDFIAPANAALTETSDHEGPYPEPPGPDDILVADGVAIPNTPFPGTRGTAAIGTAGGADRTVTVTYLPPGKRGDGGGSPPITLVLDVSLATDRPLSANFVNSTGVLTVNLAVLGGALDTDKNRALFVAAVVDALEEFSATEQPGDGSLALIAADAAGSPFSFTGAQSSPWRFTSATEVEIAEISISGDGPGDVVYYQGNPPLATGPTIWDPAASHAIQYQRLMRATSQVLDLEENLVSPTDDFSNFLWLADLTIWRRDEPEIFELEQTVEVVFQADFRGVLVDPADTDQNTATLFEDTGLVRREMPVRDWAFEDEQTVKIVGSAFNANAIYSLQYQSLQPRFPREVTVVFETRSAATSVGVTTAEWRRVETDEVVDQLHQFHQFRVTLSNVKDTFSVRVKSMGLKGIRRTQDGASLPAFGLFPC